MLYESGAVWSVGFRICLIEPGCQATQCPSVFTCMNTSEARFQAGAEALWKLDGMRGGLTLISGFSRPLQTSAKPRELVVAAELFDEDIRMAPQRPRFISGQLGPPRCTLATAPEVSADGPDVQHVEGLETQLDDFQDAETDDLIVRRATVNFTPPSPGIWTISVRWSTDEVSTRRVQVHPGELSMSLRRFVDRMDTCVVGPFRTLEGLVLCQRDATIWVYRFDGTVDHSFPGTELTVVGNEVWSNAANQLEHRTDVQRQLRLDGALPTGPTTGSMGETLPGVAFRMVDLGAGFQLLEARWDGSQLTSELHRVPDRFRLLLYEAGAIWGVEFPICLIEPGCQFTQCPAVFTCPSNSFNSVSQVGTDAVWKIEFNGVLASFQRFPAPSASPHPPVSCCWRSM